MLLLELDLGGFGWHSAVAYLFLPVPPTAGIAFSPSASSPLHARVAAAEGWSVVA
jgi:hypothetical protein